MYRITVQSVLVQAVPVHVLPKLEYQLCYGAESLTHTEACQLWAEQQLHSSMESFIGKMFTWFQPGCLFH